MAMACHLGRGAIVRELADRCHVCRLYTCTLVA